MYLATTFTFFISIVPIIPPYLVCVPWVISIGVTSSVVKAIALFGVQYFAFTVLDDMLYEKNIVALNSYVSALSVVFGVYVFGFEGVIFGPLLVCGVSFAYEVSNHGIQAAQDDGRNADEMKTDSLEEGSELEESQSTASSFEDDGNKADDGESGGASTNIFSNAMYRVISGPLVDRVRRRLSIDISTEDSVCITLVVEGLKSHRKVRFVVNKSWSLKVLYDNIRRMLRVHSVEGIWTPDGAEVLSPLYMVPNEVLHVKVRPKTRPPVHPDASGHLEPQVRVSFASHHNVSPSFRRTHSATSPISSRQGYDVEAADSGLDSESTLSSKGRRSINGGIPIVSVSGMRHRNRVKRQQSTPSQPGSVDSENRRSSFTVSAQNTPPPYPSTVSATYEDVEWTLSHRRPTLDVISDPSTHANTSEFTTAHENTIPDSSGDNGFTTPTRINSPSADNYRMANSDSTTAGDVASPQTSPEHSPAMEAAAPVLPAKEKDAENPTARRKKATKAMKGTKLLFSPVAADQEKKMVFPSEFPAAKP